MNMNSHAKGALLTVTGGMCWGLSGSMGQYLFTRQGMDSRWLVPVRLGLAGIILLLYCIARYGSARAFAPWRTARDRLDLFIFGLLGISCCQFFYFLTIQLSSAGIGTIMQDVSPVMILCCACVAGRRLPRLLELLCILLAFAGVLLLVTHGDISRTAVSPAAVCAGLVSAACVTLYNVYPGRLLAKYPVSLLQGWAFLLGGCAFALLFRPWTFCYVPNVWGALGIAVVVLVGNVIAFTAYISGVKLIGPQKGILYGFSEPVTAAIVSTVCLGSTFTVWDAAGFIAIFVMLALLYADRHRNQS